MWAMGYVFENEPKNSDLEKIFPDGISPNEKEGHFFLSQIIKGGNWGRYLSKSSKNAFLNKLSMNTRYLMHYPSEFLWFPVWKLYKYYWIKKYNLICTNISLND